MASKTFASLRIRNYRLWFLGALGANAGTWMSRVAQEWLVLTELTPHSAQTVGILTALQFLPFLFLAPVSGAIADRFAKRRILLVTQSIAVGIGVILAAVVLTGRATLCLVLGLAAIQGVVTAIDYPARYSFVSEIVDAPHVANAVALNSASFNVGRMAGPGLAGVLIALWGTGCALAISAVGMTFLLVSLCAMRSGRIEEAPRGTEPGAIRSGVRYVKTRPDILLVLILLFALCTFAMNFPVTTASMVTTEFDSGAQGYGLLGTAMAVGALGAALWAAGRAAPRMGVLAVALGMFMVAAVSAALAPTYIWFAAALVGVGLTSTLALTTANAMVQLRCAPEMRGRVMALYTVIWLGGTPIGAPIVGWVADAWGPRWAIAAGPIALGVTGVAVSVWLGHTRMLALTREARRVPRLTLDTARWCRAGDSEAVSAVDAAERVAIDSR